MTHYFDGKSLASRKEQSLEKEVKALAKKGKIPKLVSIIVGKDPASVLYVGLKKRAIERVGAFAQIINLNESVDEEVVKRTIEEFNGDNSVSGIMIQLPLPKKFAKRQRDEILQIISPRKDVDGLRSDSKFLAPTAKAVLEALKEAFNIVRLKKGSSKALVVGASGFEGSKIVSGLGIKFEGFFKKVTTADSRTRNLENETKSADVLISVTGVPGLITAEMIKDGAILVDVGSPKGDIERGAYEKASFVSPVPGGVGPVTISCLIENLVKSV